MGKYVLSSGVTREIPRKLLPNNGCIIIMCYNMYFFKNILLPIGLFYSI